MKLREPEDLQPWEVAVAKSCVRDFLDRGNCIAGMTFDDLYQECILHWLDKKHKFTIRAGASAKTFMGAVVKNKITDLLKGQGRAKRGAGHTILSLDEPLDEDDSGGTLVDRLSDPRATRAFGTHHMQVRVREVVSRLPDQRREICYLLSQKCGVTEIAAYLGISRPTAYAEIDRIRRVFEDEGLAEFLP